MNSNLTNNPTVTHELGCSCRLCYLSKHDPRYQKLWALPVRQKIERTTCRYLGDANGELIDCPTCPGVSKDGKVKTRVKTFSCNIYGICTLVKPVGVTKCCATCISYRPADTNTPTDTPTDLSERKYTDEGIYNSTLKTIGEPKPNPQVSMPQLPSSMLGHVTGISQDTGRVTWAYGVTTISSRFYTTLPRTLEHLVKGGFSTPTLYADDCTLEQAQQLENRYNLPVTPRRRHHHEQPGIAWSNYLLALWDLCIRNRNATRIVLFQDDISCPYNLKSYLSSQPYPEKGYWNLYTSTDANEEIAQRQPSNGWFRSNQLGKGALALVFDRPAVEALLGHILTSQRARSAKLNWTKNIDGWVMEILVNQQGYTEYCHKPGLVQHCGVGISTVGSPQLVAPKCYIGDEADCMDLLKK